MTGERSVRTGGPLHVVLVHNVAEGGAHRRMVEQLRELDSRVTVQECVLQGAAPVTEDPIVVPLDERAGSAPGWRRPVSRYVDLLRLMVAYRRLARVVLRAGCDVIWLNPCRRIQTPWLGSRLARRCYYYCDEPRRIDYDPSVRASTRRRTRIPYWPLRMAERMLDRSTATSVAACAANSEFSAAEIRSAYGLRPTLVSCGISSLFTGRPTGSGDHLLSVGALIPSKGHDLAVEAAADCQLGLPLHIVSRRDAPAERRRLESLAERLEVRLTIHVGVTDLVLRDLYRDALATLYLAEREPFGLASIEAQACGSPVIVSAEGGLPETVVDGQTGFVVRRGTAEAAQRLRALAERPELRLRLSTCASTTASRWSWKESAARVALGLAEVAG